MTDAKPGSEAMERFELHPPLVIRALVVGAVAALVGAALVVLWKAQGWHLVILLIGLILLLIGVVLAVAAVVAYVRGRQEVVLGDGHIVVRARGGVQRVAMQKVTEVKVSDAGLRLLLAEGHGEPVVVSNPGGRGEALFVIMMRALQVALEKDRGYQPMD